MTGPTSAAVSGTLHRTRQWGWLGAVAAGVLIAVLAGAKSQPKAQPNAGDDARLLAADAAIGEAMRAGDRTAARRLLSLQFIFVDAGGKVHGRRDFLADLKGVAAAAASDVRVRSYGLLAAVTGHRTSANGSDVWFLDVWARQKGAWRALVMQDVVLAAADAQAAAPAAPTAPAMSATQTKSYECRNPCQAIPYRVRSPAEQDVLNAFQAIEKAVVAHDAGEWGKRVADEFVVYRSGRAPIAKSERIAAINRQNEAGAAVTVGEVQTMRLAAYGDGAVMIASHAVPDNSRPPYRATRVFVRRNGQWQMAVSVHTDIE